MEEKKFEFSDVMEFFAGIDWTGCVVDMTKYDRIHYIIRIPENFGKNEMRQFAEVSVKNCAQQFDVDESLIDYTLQCPKINPIIHITVKFDDTAEYDLQEYFFPLSFFESEIFARFVGLAGIPKLEKIE